MKTIIKTVILLLAIWVLTSCNKYIVKNVFEARYANMEIAVPDVYKQIKSYGLDTISLNSWMSSVLTIDTIYVEQKSIRKVLNDKSSYQFIFSNFKYPKTSYCSFIIRFRGLEKDLK